MKTGIEPDRRASQGHLGSIIASCFDTTNDRLFTTSYDGVVCVWDMLGTFLDSWLCHQGPINALAFDPIENRLTLDSPYSN